MPPQGKEIHFFVTYVCIIFAHCFVAYVSVLLHIHLFLLILHPKNLLTLFYFLNFFPKIVPIISHFATNSPISPNFMQILYVFGLLAHTWYCFSSLRLDTFVQLFCIPPHFPLIFHLFSCSLIPAYFSGANFIIHLYISRNWKLAFFFAEWKSGEMDGSLVFLAPSWGGQ